MNTENSELIDETTPTTPSAADTAAAPQAPASDEGDDNDEDFDFKAFALSEPEAPAGPAGLPTEQQAQTAAQAPTLPAEKSSSSPTSQVQGKPGAETAVQQAKPTEPQTAAPAAVSQSPASQQPEGGADKQGASSTDDPFTALDKAIEAGRDKVIDAIAAGAYQLTQQEVEQVLSEPDKALPKLMARVHVNAVQGVLRHVAQQMPAMVTGLLKVQEENRGREEQFFKAWPQLDRSKHSQDILRAGQVFRQLNPQATMEEFIRAVGAQVVIQHGLHLQRPPGQTQQVQQAAPAPAFMPAGVGRASQPVAPPEPNIWAEMVQAVQED